MPKEPIRHHYIPQFILRNFACNDERQVQYCDKRTRELSIRDTREIFMECNLYRDEVNCSQSPVQIERDLSVYEREAAQLIKDKFLRGRKIELTKQEDAMLKLFFAIMGFRNIQAKNQFAENLTQESKEFYKYFQPNEDFEDFWKRNLGLLVKCRSLAEVESNTDIDLPIRLFMRRDVNGLTKRHFIIVEPKEGDGFILGDVYPLAVSGTLPGIPGSIPIYDVFIISPKRAIILACNEANVVNRDILSMRPGIFDISEQSADGHIHIITKRLLLEEVQEINRKVEQASNEGFVYLKTK